MGNGENSVEISAWKISLSNDLPARLQALLDRHMCISYNITCALKDMCINIFYIYVFPLFSTGGVGTFHNTVPSCINVLSPSEWLLWPFLTF